MEVAQEIVFELTVMNIAWKGTKNTTVPLPFNPSNKTPMPLVDDSVDSDNSGEEYFLPLKWFQTSNCNSEYEWSLSVEMLDYILKQQHNSDFDLEKNILKWHQLSINHRYSHMLNSGEVLEENNKFAQIRDDKLLQKIQHKIFECHRYCAKHSAENRRSCTV